MGAVMRGLDPRIQELFVGGRVKPGHDAESVCMTPAA
jgi:hypothetical protein